MKAEMAARFVSIAAMGPINPILTDAQKKGLSL